MLEIDIKLVPFGDRTRAKVLHRINIINDGTGSHEFGNYNALVREGVAGRYSAACFIRNFPRVELDAKHLLLYVLRKVLRKKRDVGHTPIIQAVAQEGLLPVTPA